MEEDMQDVQDKGRKKRKKIGHARGHGHDEKRGK
jgi:hypothetical protein